jgi:hypothetical protein
VRALSPFKLTRLKTKSFISISALLASLIITAGPTLSPAKAAFYTTNLAFKLDAQDSASYTFGSDTWLDVSGLGNNFTRAASGASSRPIYSAGNGTPNSFLFTRASQASAASPPSSGTYFSGAAGSNTTFSAGSFTVAAWIRVPVANLGFSTGHWQTMHVLSAELPGITYDWGFGVDSNGKIAFGTGGTSDQTLASTTSVNTNNWVFVAATRTVSNNSVSIYVNDGAAVTGTLSTGAATRGLTANGVLRLGAGDDGGVSFGGNIAAVFGYTAALTSSQILDTFNATKGSYGFSSPTTTSLSAAASTTTFGIVDTLTATISPSGATGTVNFLNNGSSISGCSSVAVSAGVARCAFTPTSLGSITNLTASYSGDSSYDASNSSPIAVTVSKGVTSLSLSVSTTAYYRRSTTITATSSPAGTDGKVTFTANGKKIGGCIKVQSASRSATCNWLPSSHSRVQLGATITPASDNFLVATALPQFVSIQARTNLR